MAVLTALFTAGVSVLQVVSADRTALNEKLFIRRQILLSLDLIDTADVSAHAVDKIFSDKVAEFSWPDNPRSVYASISPDGKVLAYAFPIEGAGFWGPIYGYLGVSPDGNSVVGIAFTKHSETPGLGARIEDLSFIRQFRGKDISQAREGLYLRFVSEGAPVDDHTVHAITGATRTSFGLNVFLNDDIDRIRNALASNALKPADSRAKGAPR
ncbi:MAG: FMN-binding protein [Planctomycetota bacterium]